MKRRDFVTSVFVAGLAVPASGDQDQKQSTDESEEHGGHVHHDDDERLKNHTVSFGHWRPVPGTPVDRFAADPNPRTQNGHQVIPSPVKVEVGDTVSFIISGFHNLLIYGPGTQPANVDRTKLLLSPPNTFPPLIDDPNNRVYRGLDPRATPAVQDRVEVVGFTARGRYLVICGVLPHFFDAATGEFVMFGYVDVRD
jgi:hypothetical protein